LLIYDFFYLILVGEISKISSIVSTNGVIMSILLQRINLKKQLMPFLFTLFLAGCTTNFFGSSFTGELKKDAYASSEFYMNKIGQTQDLEDQQTYKLLAARALVAENKVAQAQSLLNELTELNPEQLLDKSLIDANIAAVKGQNQEAENLLHTVDLTQLSASQLGRYYAVQARVAENKNAIIDAVKARIQMDQVLTDTQRKQENNDRTWALLRRANRGLLNAPDEGNLALAGWLALSRAYNDNLNQPGQLSQALQNWKSSYPNHSAAYLFPTELQGLFNFQQTSLSQVALLLPLSGNGQILGNTIKSGFDAAKGDDTTIQVQVYDTVTTPVNEIIEQAKQAGWLIDYPLPKDTHQATTYLEAEAQQLQLQLQPGVARMIVDRVGLDTWAGHMALEKLASASATISTELVEKYIAPSLEVNVFKVGTIKSIYSNSFIRFSSARSKLLVIKQILP